MPHHRPHSLKTDQSVAAEFADICKPAQPDPIPASTRHKDVGKAQGSGTKKAGETLVEYVRRRMAEEAHLTDAEIDAQFIDGNRLHEEGAAARV